MNANEQLDDQGEFKNQINEMDSLSPGLKMTASPSQDQDNRQSLDGTGASHVEKFRDGEWSHGGGGEGRGGQGGGFGGDEDARGTMVAEDEKG